MKAKRKASRMAFLLHLIGMGMGLCTLVVYACIKVGAESEAADYAGLSVSVKLFGTEWKKRGPLQKGPLC